MNNKQTNPVLLSPPSASCRDHFSTTDITLLSFSTVLLFMGTIFNVASIWKKNNNPQVYN